MGQLSKRGVPTAGATATHHHDRNNQKGHFPITSQQQQQSSSSKIHSRTKLYLFLICLTLYALLMTFILPTTTIISTTTTTTTKEGGDGTIFHPPNNKYNDLIGTTTRQQQQQYNNNNGMMIRNLSTESLPNPLSSSSLSSLLSPSSSPPSFGFVMRDLARRILSRHVTTNSNIVVIAPDAMIAAKDGILRQQQQYEKTTTPPSHFKNSLDTVDFSSPYSIGGTFLLHAAAEGHILHAINQGSSSSSRTRNDDEDGGHNNNNMDGTTSTWDDWWSSFGTTKDDYQQQQHWSTSSSTNPKIDRTQRPNWILAAIIDLPFGQEDTIWKDATQFLKESTTTYFIVALHARRRPQNIMIDKNNGRDGNNNAVDDKVVGTTNVEYGGIAACKALLSRRYKLQVLLVSHYHTVPGNEAWTETQFGPNALLSSIDDVERFLTWGANAAAFYSSSSGSGKTSENIIDPPHPPIFTAYIFATQGLDLAIPSNRIYLHHTSRVKGEESTTQMNLYKPLQFKSCPQSNIIPPLGVEFSKLLGETSIRVHVPISNTAIRNTTSTTTTAISTYTTDQYQIRHYHKRAPKIPGFSYQYKGSHRKHLMGPMPNDVQLWFNGNDLQSAEAACVRLYHNQSRCTTRIIPQRPSRQKTTSETSRNQRQQQQRDRPNVLLIMLDPMSRGQFERSMSQTRSVLDDLGFVHFGNYTAVGSNSGPNQAALYSGMPLISREGIKHKLQGGVWLWDRLRDAGYVTLKAEDGCIENSNMLQSLNPNTTHGEALQQLFCFDFDRPNCLGPELASNHLIRYGEQFITAYDRRRGGGGGGGGAARSSWAAFLHFVDSHEDTMVLSSALDPEMSNFLRRQIGQNDGKLSNTIVLFLSDHGLHFGPHFQSVAGRRERTEPILYVRIPPSLQENDAVGIEILERNAGLWTTAYDVHETIVQLVSSPDDKVSSKTRKGRSLVKPLPSERKSCQTTEEIPKEYCELRNPISRGANHPKCQKMGRPPSPLSFYADIPLHHRPRFDLDCKAMTNKTTSEVASGRRCQCSTSHRLWYRCDEHPWGADGVKSLAHPEEYFALVKCKGQKMAVDSRVIRQDTLAGRFARVGQYPQQQRRLSEDVNPPGSEGIGGSKLPTHYDHESRRRLGGLDQHTRPPNILFVEIDSVSLAYADRHFPLTRKILKRHRLRRDASEGKVECDGNVCAADFSLFSVVGPNSIANQAAALSGCVVSRFHESCFGNEMSSRPADCSDGGMFTSSDGSCAPCPKGTFLADPLAHCGFDDSTCCTSQYPQRNQTRICRDEKLFENGLQLFRRGPRRHNTWCPAGSETSSTSVASPWLFDVAKSLGYLTFFGDEFCYDGSPFVVQDNVFPLAPDFELQRLYCRLTESRQYNFTTLGARLCAGQRTIRGEVTNPGLAHLTNIWDAYPDVPKFAYLNAVAAHDYDFEWIKMISASETYDGELASFLSSMISREDFANTLIVLRADHGLQGGPSTLEFSMQAEHREPWTQLVLPSNLVSSSSLEALFQNQDRLATGFDLHRTLRELIWPTDISSNTNPKPPEMPDWSINLLHTLIPEGRTCHDAKVPVDFCPCDDESPDRAPGFGVCNPFDDYGDLYCIDKDEVILPAVLELQ